MDARIVKASNRLLSGIVFWFVTPRAHGLAYETERHMNTLHRALVTSSILAALALGGCRQSSPYDFCFTSSDCPSGFDCQVVGSGDRICTATCTTMASCPADARGRAAECVSFDGGANSTCWQSCSGSGSCPSGFACTGVGTPVAANICLPTRVTATAPPYASCNGGRSCLGGTDCFSITAAGDSMCTRNCNSTADCPTDAFGTQARCLSFNGGSSFQCFQACNISAGGSECEGAYDCFDADSSGVSFPPICLPR